MRRACMVGLAVLAASIGEAAAKCDQSSLEGTYSFFAIDYLLESGGAVTASTLQGCVFDIDSDGTIDEVDQPVSTLLGGVFDRLFGIPLPLGVFCNIEEFEGVTFDIDASCSFTLDTEFCDYEGQVSRDGNLASGSARCRDLTESPDVDIYFNMVAGGTLTGGAVAVEDRDRAAPNALNGPKAGGASPPQAARPKRDGRD